MRNLFIILLSLSSPVSSSPVIPNLPIESCQTQAPYGFPEIVKQNTVMLCRHQYATLNDMSAKIPVWTSYALTDEHTLGCFPRKSTFSPDLALQEKARANISDYRRTGYDMGHMAPNDDMNFSEVSEEESFLLTNVSPQLPTLNRGSWKILENAIRNWTFNSHATHVIYVGSIYSTNSKTIGLDKVVVPDKFFKIVINTATNEYAGFLFNNDNLQSSELLNHRYSVNTIKKLSGINFKFPSNGKELPLTEIWPVNTKELTKAKKTACK